MSGGTATLTSVSLSSNTVQGGKGGAGIIGGIDGNGGNGFGGGLEVSGGTVTLTSVSASSNSAQAPSTGLGEGGGVYIASGAIVYVDAFTLANVIDNTASTSYPNIFGTYIET